MFCNCPRKYNHFLVFHKDMSEGSIHNKQILFKVNNKSAKKKCKDLPKVNQTSKQHDRHCSGIPVVKQTLIYRVDVPLIFKNVGRRKEKRSIINVNLNVALTT